MENVAQKSEKSIAGAIKINEKEIVDHLDQLVRQSVAETINSLLDAEADAICQAGRYQRSPDRLDTRAGSYKRKLLTSTGEVELTVPRLWTLPFESQIIWLDQDEPHISSIFQKEEDLMLFLNNLSLH